MRSSLLFALLALSACSRNTDYGELPIKPAVQPEQQKNPSYQYPENPTISETVLLPKDSSTVRGQSVDIIFVIDNSGSMRPHQANIVANTDKFISGFSNGSGLKWKLGMITTGISDAPLLGYGGASGEFNYQTPNPVPLFQAAIGRAGFESRDDESTFDPVLKSIGDFPSFLRPDAFLALIMVTDEEEQSRNTYYPADFVSKIAAMKGGNAEKLLTYGLFGNSEDCSNGNFYYQNSRYKDLIDRTHGKTYKLCDIGSGDLLAKLGDDLVAQISATEPYAVLENNPLLDTIEVSFNGAVLRPGLPSEGGDWIYEERYNRIRIYSQAVLTARDPRITISYKVKKTVHP